MKGRSSPRLHQWTPDIVSPGTCGAAILQAAPSSFGFWGTTVSRQHSPQDTSVAMGDRNTVKDYSHPPCRVPSGGQESLRPLPQLADDWWKGGETEQE